MNPRWTNGLLVLCAVIVAAGCSSGKHFEAARVGVQKFRDQVTRAHYAEIYYQSEPELKNAFSEAEFGKFLTGQSSMFGAIKSSKEVGWHVNYDTNGTIVTLTYQTMFDNGQMFEKFVFRIKEGVAYLAGYHLTSSEQESEFKQPPVGAIP